MVGRRTKSAGKAIQLDWRLIPALIVPAFQHVQHRGPAQHGLGIPEAEYFDRAALIVVGGDDRALRGGIGLAAVHTACALDHSIISSEPFGVSLPSSGSLLRICMVAQARSACQSLTTRTPLALTLDPMVVSVTSISKQ